MEKEATIDVLAKTIWEYHHMHQMIKKADAIFVLCSHDKRVAERGAELYLKGFAPYIIFSGGVGKLTQDIFDKPEADLFAEIAIDLGVPKEQIIIENKSTNTGENVEFTKKILEKKKLDFDSFVLVQKPYMERRTYATFKKVWPEKDFVVTSPQLSYDEYVSNGAILKQDIINIMVGDLQRIKEYPKLGFQIEQEIPEDVWKAYEQLVSMGYTSHLIKE
ncbi:MAG: YdcF family protein [Candidatus Berkelbacteria bacterium]